MSEKCLIHDLELVYDMRSGFELCRECERDSPHPTPDAQPKEGEPRQLVERINAYLTSGGLFNPEMALHERVRDLLIDCRAALAAQPHSQPAEAQECGAVCLAWADCGNKEVTHGCILPAGHERGHKFPCVSLAEQAAYQRGAQAMAEKAGQLIPDDCPRCNGSGYSLDGGHSLETAKEVRCGKCGGTGVFPGRTMLGLRNAIRSLAGAVPPLKIEVDDSIPTNEIHMRDSSGTVHKIVNVQHPQDKEPG